MKFLLGLLKRNRYSAYAIALVAVLLVCVYIAVHFIQHSLNAKGIALGFDVFSQPSGLNISETLIAFESSDSLARAFFVGVLNTLKVSLLAIVFSSVLGVLIGIGRLLGMGPARFLCTAYVEVFRNLPLLLQLLCWYFLISSALPDNDSPLHIGQWLYLSKGGLSVAGMDWSDLSLVLPERTAFGLSGGWNLSPELLALWWALSVYTAAYIAEIVRAGFQAISVHQTESAKALGFGSLPLLRWIIFPQALRIIKPPVTNQYLNLIKNSSLGVAVGYPELMSISNSVLNQTGRALECVAVMMLVYLFFSFLTSFLMRTPHESA